VKIIEPSFEVLTEIDADALYKRIEAIGRTCYKSEDKITDESAPKFVEMIIKRGHLSVLEHENISVRVICDRGVSHEIVRHRIASYSQESTRYCSYNKDKHGNELTFIKPCFWDEDSDMYKMWEKMMIQAEWTYLSMVSEGAKPEEARSILPNSLKTEIVVTMNLRSWLHFFELRTAQAAHPQMQEIAIPLQQEFSKLLPVIFNTGM